MRPVLAMFYRKIAFFRSRFFHYEMIDAFKPDDIFCGMAERYVASVGADRDRPHFLSFPLLLGRTISPSSGFDAIWDEFFDRKLLAGVTLFDHKSGKN